MIRWKYVGIRLGFILVILASLAWGTAPLLRWALVQTGQSLAGAKVEIGDLATHFMSGSLEIQRVAVADSRSEFRNLMELDRASFELDVAAALRKKLVVNSGHLDGIRFHTSRADSGRLPVVPEDAADESGFSMTSILGSAGQRGKAWFDDQVGDVRQQLESDLQMVQLGRELGQRWPASYKDLEQRAGRIEEQAKQLQQRIKAVSDDPLKHLEQIKPLIASIDQLGQDAAAVQGQLRQLKQQMRDDRQALISAEKHDRQYVRERLHIDALDGDSLTEYLLAPVWKERIGLAIQWLQRSRQALPPSSELQPVQPANRGLSLIFTGFSASADVLVRQLQLSGHGTVHEQPFTFTGVVRDLTHQPSRHAQPASLELKSQGSIQFVARATMDRRSREAIDQFVFDVPALRQAERNLGDPARLALTLSPGVAQLHGDLQLHGDRLEGMISFRQADLRLTPAAGAKFSKFVSAESLQAAVGGVDRLEADVILSGSLSAPRYKLQSNLGPQLAEGMNQAVRQELMARQAQLLERANQEVEQQLADLQRDLTARHGKILSQLEIGDEQLSQLKAQLLTHLGSPKDLISRGRKLLLK